MKRLPASKGFTLLELIVATTIFSIVIAAAYGLFRSARGLQVSGEAKAELYQTARAALRALETDLKGALMSGSVFDTGLIGTSRGSEDDPQDKIELVAVNQPIPSTPSKDVRIDVSKVTYWIADGTRGKARGLVRERQRTLTSRTVTAGRDEDVEEVAAEVVGLNLRYYDAGWKETWDSTKQYQLPRAIEATVLVRGELRGQELLERFTARFYLPVGAETPPREPQ